MNGSLQFPDQKSHFNDYIRKQLGTMKIES